MYIAFCERSLFARECSVPVNSSAQLTWHPLSHNNAHWTRRVSIDVVSENVRVDGVSDDDDEDDDDDDADNDGVKDDDGEARGAVDDKDYDEGDDATDAGVEEDDEDVYSDDAYTDMTLLMMTRGFPLFRSPF